jgi:hypothetical protein
MTLGKSVTAAGIGLAVLGAAVAASVGACSSSDNNTGGDGGSTDSTGTVAPAKPSAPATTSTSEHVFAVHKLFMGNDSRTGDQLTNDPKAYANYGFNIDGKITTKTSTDVCKPIAGGKTIADPTGTGIDNSFGQNIVQLILGLQGDAAKKINDSINTGSFTVMMDTVGLSDDPKQTNTALTGALFAAGKFSDTVGTVPTWTKADDWPVSSKFVTNHDVSQPTIKFTDAYVSNGTWVSGSPSDVTLALAIQGVILNVTIHHAFITFDHTAPGKATNGTIAGVIRTEELLTGIRSVAGSISQSLCNGATFDAIAGQIQQASDILSDGTNKAGADCDAISIGIGFDADEIGKPTKAVDEVPGPDSCAAGADAGADTGTTADAGTTDASKADALP